MPHTIHTVPRLCLPRVECELYLLDAVAEDVIIRFCDELNLWDEENHDLKAVEHVTQPSKNPAKRSCGHIDKGENACSIENLDSKVEAHGILNDG